MDLRGQTAGRAMEALNQETGKVDFLGHSVDVAYLRSNFEKARSLVEKKLAGKLPVDWEKIVFEQLPGGAMGESMEDKVVIDPITLLHPANRMTMSMVIVHEVLHMNKAVMNDDLVEAMVQIYFPEGVNRSVYSPEMAHEFAEICGLSVENVWKMYRDGKYREMYGLFVKGFGGEGAVAEFNRYFPELNFTQRPSEGWGVRIPETLKNQADTKKEVDEVTGK